MIYQGQSDLREANLIKELPSQGIHAKYAFE